MVDHVSIANTVSVSYRSSTILSNCVISITLSFYSLSSFYLGSNRWLCEDVPIAT
mgnify:CR=1 FL=1